MTLPISVIVPHRRDREREDFFNRFCLPSIRANEPAEIIVQENDGRSAAMASRMRNEGARKATQELLYFCDDDLILAADCLSRLEATLATFRDRAFAYGDYIGVVLPGSSHPLGSSTFRQIGRPWDVESLLVCNYISTMSLVRRSAFVPFDETLPQLEDWDLWLTLAERGHQGIYSRGVLFHAYYFGEGITRGENHDEAYRRVQEKHKALARPNGFVGDWPAGRFTVTHETPKAKP